MAALDVVTVAVTVSVLVLVAVVVEDVLVRWRSMVEPSTVLGVAASVVL